MRRFLVLVAAVAAALALSMSPANAYGGGANHDMWQIGLSFNCNNPDFCGDEVGGFWGWVEFDRSADGTQTWGDAQLTGCTHTVGGGGFAGAMRPGPMVDGSRWSVRGAEPSTCSLRSGFNCCRVAAMSPMCGDPGTKTAGPHRGAC
jgi:hypothetical protein